MESPPANGSESVSSVQRNHKTVAELHFNAMSGNLKHKNALDTPTTTEESARLLPSTSKKFIIVPSSVKKTTLTVTSPTDSVSSSNASPIMSPLPTGARPKHFNSMRSVRSGALIHQDGGLTTSTPTVGHAPAGLARSGSYVFSDCGSARLFSDATSVRSLASIGMGSTDGRKMVIRRVPNSPNELLTILNPPIPQEEDFENDSYAGISDNSDSANLKPRRQHWANKMQFVLACIGYSVGLGNMWRFPYLCYSSGGGVFLVPYFIILIICGIPMLFMELSVGQYTGRGPIGALGQICPLFKGAGLASVVVSFLMSTYYSVIIAYAIYYFFTSFRPELPWTDCSNRWNTPDCWIPQRQESNLTRPHISRTPPEEFFENKVLQISPGIEYPGGMRWELVACLVCAWVLVYFAIWKSIKSSGKVRYLTATLPFVLIFVFLGRSLTLDGAENGLRYFFQPNWSLLRNANVWINAASQNFNSLGIAFGSMISFASYNKYNNNILHDTLAVSFVNAITSVLVGIFAFATIGNIALEQSTTVEAVISDGPGLIFIVYPQAMAKMPASNLWAVLFFFMLLCLGLNSQFAIVEVVVTSIQDGFPNWIRKKLVYHELLVLIVCVVSFFFGLPNLIQGGIYFFQLIDHYAASISIMFLAFFQIIAIAWFYGVPRLSKNVKQMTGKTPSFYFRFCWLIGAPMLLISLWVFSLINYEQPTYHNGLYSYPNWAIALGWAIASTSLICIPTYAIVNIVRANGETFLQKLRNSIKPNIYECRICGEHHCEHDFPEDQAVAELTPIVQGAPATNFPLVLQPPPPGNHRPLQASPGIPEVNTNNHAETRN
ncbi:sodium- and chloride-dependent GABA transporter ine isoform X1 [Phlebotomus argentipes]|uniref:sodium- and chloride-dependent GABA transporter ine isoform X1 n=1 Tax=Phlebotomus argentipes TaxID=94469 RepID=UPI002892E43E|nr:sodium- and chloride-dependent GABA transporter ine isoform X1 [Phlebotomus argentipes]XP_059614817.1 sodium- and chloride-dependent GABA transporter ine isoform X1 [Phlebotomus argentipes]XP_059614818.1 sodium- and chloride-dependent GABA transporter ine isoform X1 [Phlebotomus argentipes]